MVKFYPVSGSWRTLSRSYCCSSDLSQSWWRSVRGGNSLCRNPQAVPLDGPLSVNSFSFQNPWGYWNHRKGFQQISVYIIHLFTSPLATAMAIFEKFATELGLAKVPTVTEAEGLTKGRHPSFSATVLQQDNLWWVGIKLLYSSYVYSCCTGIYILVQVEAGVAVKLVFPGFPLWLEVQQLLPVPGTYGVASCSARWMLTTLKGKS